LRVAGFTVSHSLSCRPRNRGQDVKQNVEKAQGKPFLSEEDFQRLLSAAFTLQAQNCSRHVFAPATAVQKTSFAARAVVQKRTPSLSLVRIQKPDLQIVRSGRALVTSLKGTARQPGIFMRRRLAATAPFLAREKGRALAGLTQAGKLVRWRTAEALAVATIFTMLVSASIRHVSYFRPAAAPQTAQQDATTKKDLTLSGQPDARLKSQTAIRDADFVAKDVVIRYYKRTSALTDQTVKKLTSDRMPAPIQRLPQSITNLKTGVQYTVGREDAMLAADTVVRYSGSAGSRTQQQK
jgi:hypothetical protein